MELLTQHTDIKKKLIYLINECTSMQIAVAWASANHEVYRSLKANELKINKLIVGTHFYQTDPQFLLSFIGHDKVKVVKNSGEVFHPKIYYFHMKDGWECLVGSANFTNGAMNKNEEILLCVSSDDNSADTIQKDIWKKMSEWFNTSDCIEKDFLDDYVKHYQEKQKSIQILSSSSVNKFKHGFVSDIFSMKWEEYFIEVSLASKQDIDDRMRVLNGVNELFNKYTHFENFSDDERKKVAGFYENKSSGVDWLLFGSMKGNGLFKEQINRNNSNISLALDQIPLNGAVSKQNYLDYINFFKSAFENDQNRLATATRLIAMKRPDYFICLDSKNKKQFCSDFGLKENDITLENYWDEVIDQIFGCLWWSKDSSEILDASERNICNGRVAFLDTLYYNNISRANPKKYLAKNFPELLNDSLIKVVSSRMWETNENNKDQISWWFKFSEEILENYQYILFAGAQDYNNKSFSLIKVPVFFLKEHLTSFDVNADGKMINLYIVSDSYIDVRSEAHVSFKEFVYNQ